MDELSLFDYLAVLRRWKKLFVSTVLSLMVVASVLSLGWSQYRSTATIQIEQPQIQANVATPLGANERDAVRSLADQRISSSMEKVTATASLIEIITKFDLYAHERQSMPIAAIAEKMRKQIKIELVNSVTTGGKSSPERSAIAFNLSFAYTSPLATQQVTDDLVSRFLDQDLKERRTQAQETSSFIDTQTKILEKSLSEQEANIAEFQKKHGVSRPETLAFNQQAVNGLNINMQSIESQLTATEGTLGTLRGQLAGVDAYSRIVADGQILTSPSVQLKTLQTKYAALTAQYGPEHPDVIKTRSQIAALQEHVGGNKKNTAQIKAQIADVRTNLEAARKTYGAEHPDVISLQNQLQRLEEQALMQHGSINNNGIVADADNPTYLQLVMQIRATEEQRKSLLEQRNKLMALQEAYQKAIIANPEAEKELATLSRDYENAQLRYRELKAKKLSADMELKMQEERKGERLTLLNPPELPLGTYPSHKLLLIAGLFFSLMGGLVVVVVKQALSQSVIGLRHACAIVGVAPLVAIPHIATAEEKARTWQRRLEPLISAVKNKVSDRLNRGNA